MLCNAPWILVICLITVNVFVLLVNFNVMVCYFSFSAGNDDIMRLTVLWVSKCMVFAAQMGFSVLHVFLLCFHLVWLAFFAFLHASSSWQINNSLFVTSLFFLMTPIVTVEFNTGLMIWNLVDDFNWNFCFIFRYCIWLDHSVLNMLLSDI